MAKLLYQGHASLRITTSKGKIVYIDPYAGEGYDKPADMVLITHEHYDHNGIHLIHLKDTTVVIRSKDAILIIMEFTSKLLRPATKTTIFTNAWGIC